MKKIISILLAAVMVFATTSMTAFADETIVNNDTIFETEEVTNPLDYSAYDSIVELVNALDSNEYTAQSIDAVKAKIGNRADLDTQAKIDSAVIEIASEYAKLEKNSFDIEFVIINSKYEEEVQTFTYTYGSEFSLNVNNGENPYKWIISDDERDTKLNSSESDMTMIADKNCSVIVYTDTKPDDKLKLQPIKFLSFNGKVTNIVYTQNPDEVEMPEAPAIPFYYFTEWVKLNDNTYQARYLSDSICDGEHHRFVTMVSKSGCETAGYVIFQCSCGEAYRTDYTHPTGHSYDDARQYCTNGCGKINPLYEEDEASEIDPADPNPTQPSDPEDDADYGFDEGGYNNMVIAP